MPNARQWTVRSIFSFTSRIGEVKLPEGGLGLTAGGGGGYIGRLGPTTNCHSAGVRGRREAGAAAWRPGTPVLSREFALDGLLAAGAVGVLWKTCRTQLDDSIHVNFGPASPSAGNAREKVLAAFADVEGRLTSRGIITETWETPASYLARAVLNDSRSGSSGGKLARLDAMARYSRHPIDRSSAAQAEETAAGLAERFTPPSEAT